MKIIIQKNYPEITIENIEKDIIQIFMNGKEDFNVIQIERENISILIDILINLNQKKHK